MQSSDSSKIMRLSSSCSHSPVENLERLSVAEKKGTKMAAEWYPAWLAVLSEPFPLILITQDIRQIVDAYAPETLPFSLSDTFEVT
jgi:hypothetical protein